MQHYKIKIRSERNVVRFCGLDSSGLGQSSVLGSCDNGNGLSGSVKDERLVFACVYLSNTYMQRQYRLLPKWEGNQSVSLLTY